MKTIKLLIFWVILSLSLGTICGLTGFNKLDNRINLLDLLFGASTTMFSVSMGVLAGLSFRGITKISMRNRLTAHARQIKQNLMAMYGTTFAFLLLVFVGDPQDLLFGIFDLRIFVITYTACSLLFFTVNFIHMQKLREDIDEELSRCDGC